LFDYHVFTNCVFDIDINEHAGSPTIAQMSPNEGIKRAGINDRRERTHNRRNCAGGDEHEQVNERPRKRVQAGQGHRYEQVDGGGREGG
jgi:hypothetical protein